MFSTVMMPLDDAPEGDRASAAGAFAADRFDVGQWAPLPGVGAPAFHYGGSRGTGAVAS